MNHHTKKTSSKHTFTRITLATLSVGAVVAPVQLAASHLPSDAQPKEEVVKITAKAYPHPHDHIKLDPRSIRAVGYGNGKETVIDAKENWNFYTV